MFGNLHLIALVNMKIEQILMNKKEIAYDIIDNIDAGVDYNIVLAICMKHFPNLICDIGGDRTIRQLLLDEVINKDDKNQIDE